jgi:hypothetical protein
MVWKKHWVVSKFAATIVNACSITSGFAVQTSLGVLATSNSYLSG